MSTKDMMPQFALFQPSDMGNALELVDKYGDKGWKIAGGQDSYDWFKDRAKRPDAIIDLSGIAELHGIRQEEGFVEIGAMTTLRQIEDNDLIKSQYIRSLIIKEI